MEVSTHEAPIVTLTSGQSLAIRQFQLFDATMMRDLATMQAEFTNLVGYSPISIGFVGSPTWVAGGALAAGLLRAAASAGARQQAQEILQK